MRRPSEREEGDGEEKNTETTTVTTVSPKEPLLQENFGVSDHDRHKPGVNQAVYSHRFRHKPVYTASDLARIMKFRI